MAQSILSTAVKQMNVHAQSYMGVHDTVFTLANAQSLFAAAGSPDKTCWPGMTGDHASTITRTRKNTKKKKNWLGRRLFGDRCDAESEWRVSNSALLK